MVSIEITYTGDLHCEAVHEPSGTRLQTDAPKDNQGKGESFSPTDLVATALGTCIMTVMGIAARKLDVDLRGSTVNVKKEMAPAPVRRIASLLVSVHVPKVLSDEHKQKLTEAALSCPVHKSLHPDIHAPVEFVWG